MYLNMFIQEIISRKIFVTKITLKLPFTCVNWNTVFSAWGQSLTGQKYLEPLSLLIIHGKFLWVLSFCVSATLLLKPLCILAWSGEPCKSSSNSIRDLFAMAALTWCYESFVTEAAPVRPLFSSVCILIWKLNFGHFQRPFHTSYTNIVSLQWAFLHILRYLCKWLIWSAFSPVWISVWLLNFRPFKNN